MKKLHKIRLNPGEYRSIYNDGTFRGDVDIQTFNRTDLGYVEEGLPQRVVPNIPMPEFYILCTRCDYTFVDW